MVTTLAGSGEFGYKDNKGLNSQFAYPYGCCLNPFDECLVICDNRNNCIRKVTLEGDVSTFAQVPQPNSIVMNFKENCFFVSSDNHVIFKISLSGTVSVYENNAGNLFGPKKFAYPIGVTVDQKRGNLFVCDNNNQLIRQVTPRGEVSTLAGSKSGYKDGNGKSAEFNQPRGIFYEPSSESLLVCDYGNHKLRRVLLNGDVTTLCHISNLRAVTITENQTILISTDDQIYRVTCSKDQQYTATVLVSVDSRGKKCSLLNGLAVHEASHSCFVTDRNGHTVMKIIELLQDLE